MNRNWTVRLGDVATIERCGITAKQIETGTRYVGLEHIKAGGESLDFSTVAAGELGSNKFKFDEDHILYGKLRPYLSKIVAPDFSGVCSTDILPIKPGPAVDKQFLLHYLRLPENVSWAAGRATGVNLPRLSPNELADLTIPLPPLDEQQRIAAILDKADALRQKRKRAIALLDSLTQSIFLEMFGGRLADLPQEKLGALTTEARIGLVRSAKEFGPQFSIPYVRMDAIGRNGLVDTNNIQRTSANEKEIATYELRGGDFLFNTRNSRELVGKSAVFYGRPGMIYNNNLLRMRFGDRLVAEYLAAYFRTNQGRQALEERKSGTTSVFAIYQKALEALSIPIAPVVDQREFAVRVRATLKLRDALQRQVAVTEDLFASLQNRAFSGQL